MRAIDARGLREVAELVNSLTGQSVEEVIAGLQFDLDTGAADDPHTSLVNGLTSLRRASWDVETLLKEVGPPDPRWLKAHYLALGLLFEIGVKLDDWIGGRVRRLLAARGRDPLLVLRAGSEVRAIYEKYNPALRLVRDRVFHTRPWHEDEIVATLAKALYAKDVPQQLLTALDMYGRSTVTELCRGHSIGIPGIGCFNVICGLRAPAAT